MIKAKYTVVLKTLLDDETTKAEIEKALSTYPLYNPEKLYDLIPKRSELNQKVLNHYKYREIGFETPGRFIDELGIVMNEIMPRYNELFKTVEIMAELPSPFDNVDVTETYSETRTGEASSNSKTDTDTTSSNESISNTSANDSSNTTSNVNSNSKSVKSDTPQSELSTPAENIDNVSYANEVSWNKNTSNDSAETRGESEAETNTSSESSSKTTGNIESDSSSTETVEHTFKKIGNQGVNTYAHDMNEFRTSIIDVVDKIINDSRLAELFIGVF